MAKLRSCKSSLTLKSRRVHLLSRLQAREIKPIVVIVMTERYSFYVRNVNRRIIAGLTLENPTVNCNVLR